MKKIASLLIILLLSAESTFGQVAPMPLQTKGNAGEIVTTDESSSQTYLPVLVEGRMWKLSFEEEYSLQNIPDAYMTITVDGDSVVNGKVCKKLLVEHNHIVPVVYPKYIVAYEKDGRVYRIDENGKEHYVMDMNLHRGDWIYEKTEGLDDYFTTHYVVVEDILIVDGVRRKWLTIDSVLTALNIHILWLEGIGLNMDYFVDMGLGDWSRYYHRLSACYDNGKCIFSEEDFDRDKLTGITDTPKTDGTSTPLYDMQGMKRNDIRKGEVYIQNGKKHVRR